MSAHGHFLVTLDKQAEIFEERAKDVSRNFSVSQVHKFRVVCRRLRALFWLVPKEQRTRSVRRAIRDLKFLTDVFGEQRKLDIALKDAICFSRDTEEIERQRADGRRAVESAITKEKRRKYVKHLRRAVKRMRKYEWATLVPRMESLRARLETAQKHPPRGNTAGHSLRINAKKARYVLEALGTPSSRLEQLQDHLGRWHDLIVLDELTGHTAAMLSEKQREWDTSQRMLKTTLTSATHAIDSLLHASR